MRGTLRYACITPLFGRAGFRRDHREPHANVFNMFDGNQCVGSAGRYTRYIFTEITRSLVREENRRAIARVNRNGAVRTGLHTIPASRTSIQKHRFGHGAWGTQPILAGHSWRCHWLRRRITMLCKLMRCLDDRDEGVFKKMSTAVFVLWITGHREFLSC